MIASLTQTERKILEILHDSKAFKTAPGVLWIAVFKELKGADRPTFDEALNSLVAKNQVFAIPNEDTGHKYRITDAGEARLIS